MVAFLFFFSLWKITSLLRRIVIGRRWCWTARRCRLIFWISSGRRITRLLEIIIFGAGRVFFAFFLLQKWNFSQLRLILGALGSRVVVSICCIIFYFLEIRGLLEVFLCWFFILFNCVDFFLDGSRQFCFLCVDIQIFSIFCIILVILVLVGSEFQYLEFVYY